MIALARLLFVLLIVLTVIYLSLYYYAVQSRRERLSRDWVAAGRNGNREAFVSDGLILYTKSLRRRLFVTVYAIPFTMVAVLIYVTNLQ